MNLTVEAMRLTSQEIEQLAAGMLPGPTSAGLSRVADLQLRKAMCLVWQWLDGYPFGEDVEVVLADLARIFHEGGIQ
jgi:hypothetical protein